MKKTLVYIATSDECERLYEWFGVNEEKMKNTEGNDANESNKMSEEENVVRRMEFLFCRIEETGHLNPHNINNLMDAVSNLGGDYGISNLKGPMEAYALYGSKCFFKMICLLMKMQ